MTAVVSTHAPPTATSPEVTGLVERGRLTGEPLGSMRGAASRVALNELLATLVHASASVRALADAALLWIGQTANPDLAWFEPVYAVDPPTDDLHAKAEPGVMWLAEADGGVLAGVAIAPTTGEPVGTLLVWLAVDDQQRLGPVEVALEDAALWLTSSLDVLAMTPAHQPTDPRRRLMPELAAIEDQLAVVSHELRTPLSTLSAGLEMLADGDLGPLTDPQQRLLERMSLNAARLGQLVANATTARERFDIRLGRGATDTHWADAVHVVRDRAQSLTQEGRFQVQLDLPDEPVWVAASRDDLELMIDRVVDNAEKFSQEGSVVSISVAAEAGWARICVTDRGLGISGGELSQLGRPLFRGEDARRQEMPGAGLGLALARSLVHARQGSLTLESAPGEGTRAVFRLPSGELQAGSKR